MKSEKKNKERCKTCDTLLISRKGMPKLAYSCRMACYIHLNIDVPEDKINFLNSAKEELIRRLVEKFCDNDAQNSNRYVIDYYLSLLQSIDKCLWTAIV